MKNQLIRAALLGAGCIDPDAALKIGDFSALQVSDAGDIDAGSLQAAVKALKQSKAYLFGSAASAKEPGDEPKSALDMTPEEYRAAKWKMKGEAEQRRRESMSPPGLRAGPDGKSANDMSEAEYAAARGYTPRHSATVAQDQVADLMGARGSRGRETVPSGGAALLRQRHALRRAGPTAAALQLRGRRPHAASAGFLAPSRS